MPPRILLIIGGGIAAYKSLELIRLLKTSGHDVSVVMTKSATQFVTPLSVQALTGEAPHTQLFSATEESRIGHIVLSRSADLILICPASANLIAKMRYGLADDLASTLLLAADTPIVVAPAMNNRMWLHPATQENVAILEARGVAFIGPEIGDMACGEFGPGRLSPPERIMERITQMLTASSGPLKGTRVLVTAGPTQEALDPVRFIANHSSGKQGYAIAREFAKSGADVTLVSGQTTLPAPSGVTRIVVTTAQEMLAACQAEENIEIAICAAAVSDWRPKIVSQTKLKKSDCFALAVEFIKNPDILATLAAKGPHRPRLVIGFAAETHDHLTHAQKKRTQKKCDWIIANAVEMGTTTFGSDDNTVTFIDAHSHETWPTMSKQNVARRLVQRVLDTRPRPITKKGKKSS